MSIRSLFLACKRLALSFKHVGSLLFCLGFLILIGEGLPFELKSVTTELGYLLAVVLLLSYFDMSICCILTIALRPSPVWFDVFER